MKKILIVCSIIIAGTTTSFSQSNLFELRSSFDQGISLPVHYPAVEQTAKKSAATAILYSLIVPGMGELYVDGFDNGKYSLIAEGGLWLTYFSFRQYGGWLQDDARRFAALHAGADISGKNDQFFVDVSNFQDTYDYNEKKLRDRTPDKLYDPTGSYYWNWDSDVHRLEFRSQRVASTKVLSNAGFIIGAIVVNHIISAINAARLTRIYNNRLDEDMGAWWIESSLINQGAKPDGIQLTLVKKF